MSTRTLADNVAAALARTTAQTWAGSSSNVGKCLYNVEQWCGGDHWHEQYGGADPSAIVSWKRNEEQHPGDKFPPAGVPVYYSGGQYGHVALALGNGMVRSTDVLGPGTVGTVPLEWFAAHWGRTYLGWGGYIAGRDLTPPPAPPAENPYAYITRQMGRAPRYPHGQLLGHDKYGKTTPLSAATVLAMHAPIQDRYGPFVTSFREVEPGAAFGRIYGAYANGGLVWLSPAQYTEIGSPRPNPMRRGFYRFDKRGDAIFGIRPGGSETHLSPGQYASLGSPAIGPAR